MKCPVCTDTNLTMSERQGIEIDYCPQCRGVWLDRGELDKIIERSTTNPPQTKNPPPRDNYRGYSDHHTHHHDRPYKKKPRSFLSELFD